MRNEKGQFLKGFSPSPQTQFKKGEHWRKPRDFWNKEWLEEHYLKLGESAECIARKFNVSGVSIRFWMAKHGIKKRTISEQRKIQYWGSSGEKNPMFNKKGILNPNWRGGLTGERLLCYSSIKWKKASSLVWTRDKATCQKCGRQKIKESESFHIHHIVSFANKELRTDPSNLVLLCKNCHNFIHSKKNINHEFIQKI